MWLILVCIAIIASIYWFKNKYSYWKHRAVQGPDPIFIVGNILPTILKQQSLGEIVTSLYRKYDGPVVGFYRMLTPCLIIKDLELIKSIVVKDFASFHDNEFYVTMESDASFGGNPFVLKGDEWKEKRSHITGCFTSGKVRAMFNNIRAGAEKMSIYLKKITEDGSKLLEGKEFCCLYTLETVLSCAYGVEAHVFDKTDTNFLEMGQKLYYSEYLETFNFFLSIIFPKIAKFIRVRFTNEQTEAQIFDIIRSSLKYRDKRSIDIKDFLGTIAPLRSRYTEKEVLGLASAFYLDGQETSGLVMGHLLYELAANPEAQNKLRNEVEYYLTKDKGQLSYESLQEMPYLDACFKENLRLHSILHYLPRICTKTYSYTFQNGSQPPLVIEKGTPIMIPLYGIHLDPNYFEEPYKFRPERFLDNDNAQKRCFMGFGDGPRACIGRRFGIAQVKTGAAYLVKDFEISVNRKTRLPLKTDAWDILVVSIDGLWLDFKKLS